MKYIKKYKSFESISQLKNYENIDTSDYDVWYYIPFSLGENDVCISDEDNWLVCWSNNYVYDYISDIDIKNALNENLDNIDISKDWTNYINGFETAYSNNKFHTLRIAKIIKDLLSNKPLKPISVHFSMDSYQHDMKNHIMDGNHRIRALQYLKYDTFPAYIGGGHSKYLIDYLNKL